METRSYRPDIDGLRGLAMLAVLLFHYRLAGISGGFIGVDVFFVISGFLITRNILQDIQAGTWSYGRFYTRRTRRLFPALYATLTGSFLATTVILMPNDLEWFATTALHSIVPTSNFLYWMKLGYFGPTAGHTPLLHTWSLSVEEQFYLVWPALMLLVLGRAAGRGPGRSRWLIGFLVLAGAFSVWGGQRVLESDARAAFYLMPFRIVELAAGALLVWLPRLPEQRRWVEEPLLAAGLTLVVYCIFAYEGGMPFPGINALLPTLGATLILYAGRAPRTGLILRNPVMIGIGLISYSLYLVHWPLLVLTELALMRPIGGWEKGAMMLASAALAWTMVRLVERPFREAPRRPRHLSPAAFGLSCAGLTIVLLWTSSLVLVGDGWPWRIPAEIRAPIAGLELARQNREARNRTGICHLNMWVGRTALGGYVDDRCMRVDPGRPNYLIIGDSHGADRYTGLSSLYPEVNFLQMTTASCRPLMDTDFREYHCQERMEYAFRDYLPRGKIDGVVLAGRWQAGDLGRLEKTLAYVRGLGIRVIVLGPAAEFVPWVADLVFHYGRREGLEDWVSRFLVPERRELDQRMRRLSEASGADYYSSIDAFCPAGHCPVLSPDGKLLIVDYGHQSPAGALVQAKGYKDLGLAFPRVRVPAATMASVGG